MEYMQQQMDNLITQGLQQKEQDYEHHNLNLISKQEAVNMMYSIYDSINDKDLTAIELINKFTAIHIDGVNDSLRQAYIDKNINK